MTSPTGYELLESTDAGQPPKTHSKVALGISDEGASVAQDSGAQAPHVCSALHSTPPSPLEKGFLTLSLQCVVSQGATVIAFIQQSLLQFPHGSTSVCAGCGTMTLHSLPTTMHTQEVLSSIENVYWQEQSGGKAMHNTISEAGGALGWLVWSALW
ncbi:Hypothetical predicted protein [Pelobates cultripes]|uniref:Uncharacterized protein n=1 Tax=Pelobates cultripes TaxID=61616 RepID=A0AAD1VP01_PELCU|nr:Hypothetical predicted protein [Pelobates cultripes]